MEKVRKYRSYTCCAHPRDQLLRGERVKSVSAVETWCHGVSRWGCVRSKFERRLSDETVEW